MQGKNFDIFISYRRSDGDKVARILDLAFKNDGYRCFLDYNSIEGGLFEEKIHVAIKDAPVFIMVMTPDYFSRCSEKGDWVRKEIELALKYEKTIIPISIDNSVDKVPMNLDENFRIKVGAHNFAIVYMNSTFDVTFKKMLNERIRNVEGLVQYVRNKAKVKVTTDADCDWKRENELIATLQAGKENLIYISGGKYKVKASSSEFPDISHEVQIDINNVSFEYDFKIELAHKIKRRKKYQNIKLKLKRYNVEFIFVLLAIVGFFIGVWISRPENKTIETANETAIDRVSEQQNFMIGKQENETKKTNEDSIRQAEAKKQAEINVQKEKEKNIKEEQERKLREEEKKRLNEKKFNENRRKGNEYFDKFLEDPENLHYKEQAKYYYGLALQYKKDATIQDRYEKLKK